MGVDVDGLIRHAKDLVKALNEARHDPDELQQVAAQAKDLVNEIEGAYEEHYEIKCGL